MLRRRKDKNGFQLNKKKLKNARAKRAKLLFFIVKYANYCRLRCRCWFKLPIIFSRSLSLAVYNDNKLRIQRVGQKLQNCL